MPSTVARRQVVGDAVEIDEAQQHPYDRLGDEEPDERADERADLRVDEAADRGAERPDRAPRRRDPATPLTAASPSSSGTSTIAEPDDRQIAVVDDGEERQAEARPPRRSSSLTPTRTGRRGVASSVREIVP